MPGATGKVGGLNSGYVFSLIKYNSGHTTVSITDEPAEKDSAGIPYFIK